MLKFLNISAFLLFSLIIFRAQTAFPADCTVTISPSSASFTASGGKASINVTASASGCSWKATSNQTWTKISSQKKTKLNYSVSANTGTASRTGTITIGDKTFTITQAEPKPAIVVSASSLNFGAVKTNASSTRQVTIKNNGTAPLSIEALSLSDAENVFSFYKDSCSNKAVDSRKSCVVSLKFSPKTAGSYTGTLSVPSNDPDKPAESISLIGDSTVGSSGNGTKLTSSEKTAVAEAFAYSALSAGSSTGSSSPSAKSPSSKPFGDNSPAETLPSYPLEMILSSPEQCTEKSQQETPGLDEIVKAVSCSPQSLLPPKNCPGGGNIYFTVNASCSGPSGCCYSKTPCTMDNFYFGGQGSVIYNSCKFYSAKGDSVVINGTLTVGVTTNVDLSCGGAATANAKVTITGMPTITVNGHSACSGSVFITANASYDYSVKASVSGTVCGQQIYQSFNYGCAVTCGSSCCKGGTLCGTCSSGCLNAAYPVDCCNGYSCPAGKTCSANNSCK